MSKQTIWAKLKAKGFSDTACAAIMGNIQAESAFRSNNVEDRCPMSDEAYTEAVDNGNHNRDQFMRDAYGYGLCQWTYYTRKAGLYDFAKSRGVSIADEQMQIDWMMEELNQAEYSSVLSMLQSGVALYIMTRKFMVTFENPADQSEEAINYRFRLAQAIYYEFAGTEATEATEVTEQVETDKPETPYWPPRVLCESMLGTDVRLLQDLLSCRGYGCSSDGIFGKSTKTKVMEFQKANGLDVDGIVGKYTWAKLIAY